MRTLDGARNFHKASLITDRHRFAARLVNPCDVQRVAGIDEDAHCLVLGQGLAQGRLRRG